jgi:hypothetical protein
MSKITPSNDWRTMSDEDFAKTKPEPIRGSGKEHKPPRSIKPTPKGKPQPHRKRTAVQTLVSQIAYMESLPENERGTLIVDEWPIDTPMPEFVRLRASVAPKKAKTTETATRPKLKDNIMNAILTRIWAFVRDVILQWAFPFPIFKKGADGVTPIVDDNGKKVVDWVAKISARALSLVVVFWGTVEVLGLPIAEWVKRIVGALGLPFGV